MNEHKGLCLRCKFFRLDDSDGGVCRVDKTSTGNYPQKRKEENCRRWQDCGQQYFIRIGWLRAKIADLAK